MKTVAIVQSRPSFGCCADEHTCRRRRGAFKGKRPVCPPRLWAASRRVSRLERDGPLKATESGRRFARPLVACVMLQFRFCDFGCDRFGSLWTTTQEPRRPDWSHEQRTPGWRDSFEEGLAT